MPEEEYEDIEMEEDFVLDIGMLMNVENAYK